MLKLRVIKNCCYHLCGNREQAAGTMKIKLLEKKNIFHH